jgi:hypothetical protein
VNGARHQLLAGAALAQDQHRGVGGRHALDDAQHLLHTPALGDDPAEGRRARRMRAQRLVVAQQLALLRGLAHEDVELLDARGLAQVVVGAQLHRLHRGRHVLHPGHHDDLWAIRRPRQLPQHLDAGFARHPHVEHEDVVCGLRDALDGLLAVAGAFRLVPLARQLADDQIAQRPLVVGHEHADHGAAASNGSDARTA